MRLLSAFLSVTAIVITSIGTAQAEQPPNVGSADVESTECFTQILVGPPGNFIPFVDGTHGVLFAKQGDGKVTYSNSAKGNRNLSCHGKTQVGDEISGWDVAAVDPQEQAMGTVVAIDVACEALRVYGSGDACRGKGKGAIIVNPIVDGTLCSVGGLITENWHVVYTNGGTSNLRCLAKE